ncbi:TPA: hypothetical protein RVS92_001216 [Pasteurella multocida]|nr:hypothetical protein [Pasteurella multocida]HDR1125575.1 hypothetical protein [Pasteurella multocida]HDR1218112.1 hypothetical protein [Pasteurella multocida]HDR1627140.1 hypothetical protein [Pasteurella multocida]HDR1628704.1 hypothetical protein [Pasteurella multocida]
MNFFKRFLNADVSKIIQSVLIVIISIWGYYQAYNSGYQASRLEFEIIKNQVIQAQLLALDKQIKQANQANLVLSENLGRYQQLGDKTTDELQKILAKTNELRRHCQFNADSMHALNLARTRAAQAVTRGIGNTMSSTRAITTESK